MFLSCVEIVRAAARYVFVLFATSMFMVPQSLQCWKKQGAGGCLKRVAASQPFTPVLAPTTLCDDSSVSRSYDSSAPVFSSFLRLHHQLFPCITIDMVNCNPPKTKVLTKCR